MIRIVRGQAPDELGEAQRRQLAQIAKLDAGLQPAKKDGTPATRADYLIGYDAREVKERLYADQSKKCAWCERRQSFSSNPVEHIRPKNGAWRDVPDDQRSKRARSAPSSPAHYWWLTWSWSNLVFSCVRCNDRGHKANYFPLTQGTAEVAAPSLVGVGLPPAAFATTVESPLLLDPTEDGFDFLAHVRWEPSQTHLARRLWSWTPRSLTPRGDATIKILRLAELADEVRDHLAAVVLPSLEEIEQHLHRGRRGPGERRWATLLETTLCRTAQFTAATWCGLEAWLPSTRRREWGLPDPPRP